MTRMTRRQMLEEPFDKQLPQPQHEYAGGGPGSRFRTAIGAADNNSRMDPSTLPDPPWWFALAGPWIKVDYMPTFRALPTEIALSLLEKAQVPPLYRLALGLQWGFIDSEREEFSWLDLAEIMRDLELLRVPMDIEMERIEARSKYQIWRKFRHELPAKIEGYWTLHNRATGD
jgi:hypothetical protein